MKHSDQICDTDWSRYPSSGPTGALGFKHIIDQVHAMGLKFQLRMERGIQIEAVQQKTKVLGTAFTAVLIFCI